VRPAIAISLLLILCALPGLAQTDPWERVKLIERGKNVSVTLVSGKSVSGKMEEWQPDALVLRKGKGTVAVAKAEAAKVYLSAGMSRGRRAAWAFGAGLGAGAVLYAVAAATAGGGDTPAETAGIIAVGGAFIGGIAAGIAALIPQHKELIYTARP
jgi:hypothetical protein